MKEQLTIEFFESVYKRAIEYCKAKFGSTEPDRISISSDGMLQATYITYCCGESDENTEYINPFELTDDLEKVYEERKIKEEQEKKRQREIEKQKQILKEKLEKESRRQQFLKLKQEFEP